MKLHRSTFYLTLCLALTPVPGSHAQLLQTQDWENWNTSSTAQFPGENWMLYETPEEAGWSSEKLSSAQRMSNSARSAAVMVIYDGAILAQWGQVERRFMCHSIRKSLLSALYGIAVAKGSVDIDQTIGSIGIDDDQGLTETEKSAKVSDLLKSRSGVYLPAAYETPSGKDDRPVRGSHNPGTHWYYNNWDFNVLATIFNKMTAGDVFQSFQANIAEPLQMQDFDLRHTYYHLEPEHSRHPAYPFRMSARDLARFGLLFLNDGRWKDKQIVPAEWVRESTQAYSKKSHDGYGYMWWTISGQLGDLGTYAALGYGGHAIYVVPSAKLVLVHRVDTYHQNTVNWNSVRNILKQVLKARIGPPKANPELVDIPASPPSNPDLVLTKEQLAVLTGNFRQDGFTATVREVGGNLEIESPHWGRYILFPRSSSEFLVEDAELRLEFELDNADKASSLQIWFDPEKPYEVPRVP